MSGHIKRKCTAKACRLTVPAGARSCPACGGRVAYIAAWAEPGGRRKELSFPTRSAASAHLDGVGADLHRGEYVPAERGAETLGDYWARWHARAVAAGAPVERTLITYADLFARYLARPLGSRRLRDLTRGDCQRAIDAAGTKVGPARTRDAAKVLRLLLNDAIRDELLTRNPAAALRLPALPEGRPWTLSASELEAVADAVTATVDHYGRPSGERYRALVLVAGYGALRWSEVVALRVSDLDLMRGVIRVGEHTLVEAGRLIEGHGKTERSRRRVTLPAEVALELARHLEVFGAGEGGLVFTAPEGGPIRRPHFGKRIWRPAVKAAGLEGFTFRNLRHTGISLALEAGMNPVLVAFRAGHTSTRMIERHYGNLRDGVDATIAAELGALRAAARVAPKAAAAGGADVVPIR